jgi:protein mago nashi
LLTPNREDDAAWPKKNVGGRQELEVRIDKEHISFEVRGYPV